MAHTFVKRPHLACRKIGEETVVLDVKTRCMYALNEDGARALAILSHPKTASEVTELCADDSCAEATVVSRTLGFLEELAESGVLERLENLESTEERPRATPEPKHVASSAGSPWSPRLLWQEPLSTAVHMFQTYGPLDLPCQ